jgi:Flp pilus assembly protein TadG
VYLTMRRATPQTAPAAGRERGVVSLEFAAIAPVLLIMVIGAFDISRAIAAWQQTLSAAQWVAISANQLALQTDNSTSLTPAQASMAMTTAYGALPQIKEGLNNGQYSVTLSGVYFAPNANGNGPANTASIIWSVPLLAPLGTGNMQTVVRTCGNVQEVAVMPQNSSNLNYLPTKNITTMVTLLVADVHYQYLPTFFNFITGPVDFWESYAYPPSIGANNQSVCYAPNQVSGYQCPGYNPSLCIPAS